MMIVVRTNHIKIRKQVFQVITRQDGAIRPRDLACGSEPQAKSRGLMDELEEKHWLHMYSRAFES